jgi:TIR domain
MSQIPEEAAPVRFCTCYAREDDQLRGELHTHLSPLERRGVVQSWYDRNISAGENWRSEIDDHLRNADFILLLISADFVSSDYCYDVEMKYALERHESELRLSFLFCSAPSILQGSRSPTFRGFQGAVSLLPEKRDSRQIRAMDCMPRLRRIFEPLSIRYAPVDYGASRLGQEQNGSCRGGFLTLQLLKKFQRVKLAR